jgi:hypothetical protein
MSKQNYGDWPEKWAKTAQTAGLAGQATAAEGGHERKAPDIAGAFVFGW